MKKKGANGLRKFYEKSMMEITAETTAVIQPGNQSPSGLPRLVK